MTVQFRLLALILCVSSWVASCASAQDPAGNKPAARKDASSNQQTQFAPGVVTVIPPAPDAKETFDGPLTLTGLLDAYPELEWSGTEFPNGMPHYDPRSRTLVEMAKQAFLRREIYCFEFSFKPLRQIYIDLPRADGQMQRKLVWYMVYRIRYRGGDLRPGADEVTPGQAIYRRVESIDYQSRRVFPIFVLRDHVSNHQFVDRLLAPAIERIKVREKITAPLYNSVEISKLPIPLSKDDSAQGAWGVATWEDIDPNIDFFTVSVFGLTNAFEQDGLSPDAPYRRKSLDLNFYRPGDAIDPTADTIRFGVPAYKNAEELSYILKQYGLTERLDYQWKFR